MTRCVWLLACLAGCGVKQAEMEAFAAPDDAARWEALGDAYRKAFRTERASDAYREAMRLDPERTHLDSKLSDRVSGEVRQLRREAMSDPTNDELWGDLGDALLSEGDEAGARQSYLRAFQLDPSDTEWHSALVELGEAEQLLAHTRATLDEGNDESLGDLADLLAATGDLEQACTYWRRAAELDPSDEEWLDHAQECGFSNHEMGDAPPTHLLALPEADDIPGLVDRRNGDVSLLIRLGQAYLTAGQREDAETTLWGALLVAPTHEEALQSYLVASRQTRRQVLEELRERFPENDEVLGALGDHYLDLGLRDRARDLYGRALRFDADDPEWKAKHALLRR